MVTSYQSVALPSIAQSNRVLRNAYLLLALSLLPTIAGAAVGIKYSPINAVGPFLHFALFMVVLFGGQKMIIKNRNSITGVYWLLGFSAMMGYFISPLLSYALSFSNGVDLIAVAFGGTSAIFFTLAGYASTTKRDLSSPRIGNMLSIGMLMLFIGSIVSFFASSWFDMQAISLAISTLFLFIASGFILYTINSVVRGGEKNYIVVTLTLYIMVLNIFQSLLHLLLAFAGNRD